MDFVKDALLGCSLLVLQISGPLVDVLGALPLPQTPKAWGEMLAWFVLYLVLRFRDRGRVTRRVRAQVKRIKDTAGVAPVVVPLDAVPL